MVSETEIKFQEKYKQAQILLDEILHEIKEKMGQTVHFSEWFRDFEQPSILFSYGNIKVGVLVDLDKETATKNLIHSRLLDAYKRLLQLIQRIIENLTPLPEEL